MSNEDYVSAIRDNWTRNVQDGIAFPDVVEVHPHIGVVSNSGLHYYVSVAPCNEHRASEFRVPILNAMRKTTTGSGRDARVDTLLTPQVFRVSPQEMDSAYFAGFNVLRYDSGWHEICLWGNNVCDIDNEKIVPLDSVMAQVVLDCTMQPFLNIEYSVRAKCSYYGLPESVVSAAQALMSMGMIYSFECSQSIQRNGTTWEFKIVAHGNREKKRLSLILEHNNLTATWDKDHSHLYPSLYSSEHPLRKAGLLGT